MVSSNLCGENDRIIGHCPQRLSTRGEREPDLQYNGCGGQSKSITDYNGSRDRDVG